MIRPVRRALLSVSDKTGLAEFAAALNAIGVKLISTGGTAGTLKQHGLPFTEVASLTGFPEILGGRVKTLHPNIHAALLAKRGNSVHEAELESHAILPIDLVVVNLYPFEEAAGEQARFEECIENIDIGGPAMLRAAAKNHDSVAVVCDPVDYPIILDELRANAVGTTLATRKRLAAKAFARTAAYDAAISRWFDPEPVEMPAYFAVGGKRLLSLRYGENPHQQGALYAHGTGGIASARQVQGKELSHNNIADADAAWECVRDFGEPACVIVKHANPCGVALAGTLAEAYERALRCDKVSAFGGIIAFNRPLDVASATAVVNIFTEVIVAPAASAAALQVLAPKTNLRLLIAADPPSLAGLTARTVSGGLLVQSTDRLLVDDDKLRIVTKRQPTAAEMIDLKFAFTVAKHVKSNAIVYAKEQATTGIGAGQMSRLDSCRIAALKAKDAAAALGLEESLAQGSVVASDAFFPFVDALLAVATAGASAVIQPGGSVRDDEIIAAADKAGLAMVFTGTRHFRH